MGEVGEPWLHLNIDRFINIMSPHWLVITDGYVKYPAYTQRTLFLRKQM